MISEAEFSHTRPARTHRNKVLAHAATRLAAWECLSDASEISELFRAFLKTEERRLKIALRLGASGCQTAAARSFVLDLVADAAFRAGMLGGEGGQSAGVAVEVCARSVGRVAR